MTLEQMKERRELLVKERERKLATALENDDADKYVWSIFGVL